jgi:hypothetical protein
MHGNGLVINCAGTRGEPLGTLVNLGRMGTWLRAWERGWAHRNVGLAGGTLAWLWELGQPVSSCLPRHLCRDKPLNIGCCAMGVTRSSPSNYALLLFTRWLPSHNALHLGPPPLYLMLVQGCKA